MEINPIMMVISILYLVMLIVVGVKLHGNLKTNFDDKIRIYFDTLKKPKIFKVMGFITKLANMETIILFSFPIGLYLLSQKNFIGLTTIALSTGSAVIITQVIKIIFRRNRPAKKKKFNAFGYSYPSGHSTVGTAFYISVVYVFSVGTKFFIPSMIGVILLSLLIAFSRIMLGVHWFSDVMAGVGLGLVCAYWGIYFYTQGYYFKFIFSKGIFN